MLLDQQCYYPCCWQGVGDVGLITTPLSFSCVQDLLGSTVLHFLLLSRERGKQLMPHTLQQQHSIVRSLQFTLWRIVVADQQGS